MCSGRPRRSPNGMRATHASVCASSAPCSMPSTRRQSRRRSACKCSPRRPHSPQVRAGSRGDARGARDGAVHRSGGALRGRVAAGTAARGDEDGGDGSQHERERRAVQLAARGDARGHAHRGACQSGQHFTPRRSRDSAPALRAARHDAHGAREPKPNGCLRLIAADCGCLRLIASDCG